MFGKKPKTTGISTYKEDVERLTEFINNLQSKFTKYSYDSFLINENDYQCPELIIAFNSLIRNFLTNNLDTISILNSSVREVTTVDFVSEMLSSVKNQKDTLNKMVSGSEELRTSISEISDNLQNIVSFINKAHKESEDSVINIKDFIQFVKQSFENISVINIKVNQFYDRMKSITTLTDVVTEIAEKTNLLALNAAIEAARAGENGRGFAVVADEVGKLAANTKSSALTIADKIAELQEDVDNIVDRTNFTSNQLENSRGLVEKSVDLVEGISNSMNEINSSVMQIASSIEEQDHTIEGFTNEINDLSSESKVLEDYCMNTSEILFKSVRNIDKVRGRVARFSMGLELKELLSLFRTDHIMYVYRFYNMLLGFEELTVDGMGNPAKCKLGVWYTTSADDIMKNNSNFISLGKHHKELHRLGVNCINAFYANEKEKARNEYSKMKEPLKALLDCLDKLSATF